MPNRDNEVRAVLGPVAALAEKYGPAVVVVAHRRKGFGTLADDLALGSRAFTGLARAVWHVTPDPDNKARRLLLSGKTSFTSTRVFQPLRGWTRRFCAWDGAIARFAS